MIEPGPARPLPLATGKQWAVSLVALAVIALGIVGLRLWNDVAWTQYIDVRAEYDLALDAANDASRELDVALRDGTDLLRVADTVAESAKGFVADDVLGPLEQSRGSFAGTVGESAASSDWVAPLHERHDETALLWDLMSGTSTLSETSVELATDRVRLDAVTAGVSTGRSDVSSEIVTVINAAGAVGEERMSKYSSATNKTYRALKSAVEGAKALAQVNYRATEVIADVVTATDAAASSHKSKEKAKAGPLAATRNEIEKFARSIAGGVRIDFTWKDIVIGHGQGRSAAGTATWDTADTGYSSITLTNSIARYWTTWAGYRALVAHEVGHAITSKCYDLFRDTFKSDNERWATAWAIGKGYTTSAANGAELYGHPTAAQVAATKKCR